MESDVSHATPTFGVTRVNRHPIDAHIGNQVRLKRIALGQTKEQLCERLGVTARQLEKYENGSNRVGASRLLAISRALNSSPAIFFEDLGPEAVAPSSTSVREPGPQLSPVFQTAELLAAFIRIEDVGSRAKVIALAKALAHEVHPKH